MLSVNPPTQCSGTPSDTRLSVNPFVVAQLVRARAWRRAHLECLQVAHVPTLTMMYTCRMRLRANCRAE